MSDEEIGSREPREKTHLEIKPFNKETNEDLNQSATFNHIDNGSRLPMKFEIFPKQLLGMPIYDLGPRPNEKVNYLSLSLKTNYIPWIFRHSVLSHHGLKNCFFTDSQLPLPCTYSRHGT